MSRKLYSNLKRMTTGFCIGIFCVTVSVLALRLTVFSDIATAPSNSSNSSLISSQHGDYQINSKIYFSSATSKADLFITNSSENLIKIDIVENSSGRSVLSTGLIQSGASLSSARMNPDGQAFNDGIYSCTAEITAYAPDDLKREIKSATEDIEIYIGEKPDSKK